MAGRSRSATLTIAYLLWNEGVENTSKYKVYNVLDTVQAKRPIVQPNAAFIKQLVQWEDDLKSRERNSIQLNEAQSMAINEIQQITQRIKKQECWLSHFSVGLSFLVFINFLALCQTWAWARLHTQTAVAHDAMSRRSSLLLY